MTLETDKTFTQTVAALLPVLHLILLYIILSSFSTFSSGVVAAGGPAGDCEQRCCSDDHREIHLPTQIQEGKAGDGFFRWTIESLLAL